MKLGREERTGRGKEKEHEKGKGEGRAKAQRAEEGKTARRETG